MSVSESDSRLAEQQAYYRAVAAEYDEAARRDRVELDRPEVKAALRRFDPAGDVLELAGGTGQWTTSLIRYADHLTVLDGCDETLALNRAQMADATTPVEYVTANMFTWRPPRRYDVVFFSYWLSHVPSDLFDGFWDLIDRSLCPGGRVFFLDDAYPRDAADGHVEWDDPERGVSRRKVRDRQFEIVKVYWEPSALRVRLAERGFEISVTTTSRGYCIFGYGSRAPE